MDFWSRLLAHTSLSPSTSRKDAARDPAKRLHRFEKEYGQLLQIWRNSSNLARDAEAAENLEIRLQELTDMLSDESRRPLPHPCIQFASMKQIYVPIGKIATTSYNEWLIKEAVLFFATLIESEEEAFVENTTFSSSLTNLLVRITGVNSIGLGPDTEARVVELAFNITTKIRLEPNILNAWFRTQDSGHGDKTRDDRERFAGKTQKQDFPLFYILMDYIHHEGKVGDFARTGLLYIIESASSSAALEQWVVESDLSTLMATGLGALYSQLSRKLVVDYLPHELPPVLALSDYQHPTSSYEIVASCSPQFQAHLETFLSHLLFWQDVLNHCRSVEVKSTLLEHFQVIFLQQLLYPSLLESSDIDGGSSVAVITYLRRILESLDHPDMINLILHYLLALPDAPAPNSDVPSKRSTISAARKRKSMDLASMVAQQSDLSVTPLLFNLVDLILACLRSHSQQTIHVTLQLVSTILKRHHRYAVTTLLRTEGVRAESAHRTAGAHNQEVEYLMSLAGSIGGQDNFDEVYESILKDSMARLESHPCSLKLVAPKTSTNNHKLPEIPDSLPGAPRDVRSHTVRPDDPLLGAVLDHLETFFINPVDTNLSVTETITDLAICGYVSVEGWMLRSPQKYTYDENPDLSDPTSPGSDASTVVAPMPPSPDSDEFEDHQQHQSRDACLKRPRWEASSLPRFLAVLQQLCDQVAGYRETIPRFDSLLQQRREAFQTADTAAVTPAAAPAPPRKPPSQAPGSSMTPDGQGPDEHTRNDESPARPSGLEGFAQRLLSELGTPTRSSSPRGRREPSRTPAGISGGYGIGTPTAKPMAIPPKEFPLNYENPGRSGVARSYSPSSTASGARDETASSSYGGKDPVASQAAAFAAVDQSILSRQVGIPGRVQPIPLKFDKKPVDEEAVAAAQEEEEEEEEKEGEAGAGDSEDGSEDSATSPEERTVSVSHVVTNVIIFQSFLMELASLVQVRAGLFNEVRFV